MPDGVETFFFGSFRLSILEILPVRLESGDNVELRLALTRAGSDGATVYHDTRSVQPPNYA